MLLTLTSILGGIAIACLFLGIVYAIISGIGRKPSVISWIIMSVMALVMAVSGTMLCMSVNLYISADDTEEEVQTIADDIENGINGQMARYGDNRQGSELKEGVSTIKSIALSGTQYYTDVMRRQAKRSIWRNIWVMTGTFIVCGTVSVLLAESHGGRRPYSGRDHSSRHGERTSRAEGYRRRR